MTDPLIDAFPRLIVEIKQLTNSNPDAAERRAKRLLDWVNRAYPIGCDA